MEFQEDKYVCCTGTSQWERFPEALQKDFIGIDERSFEDLLCQAAEFARKVRYYNDNNRPSGDWSNMFSLIYDYKSHAVKKDVLCSLAESSSVPPQLSLLIAFLKMFQVEQKKLNSLVDSNLEFYYREALGFEPKKGECGTVTVEGELVKNQKSVFVPEGTCFSVGKDSEGKDILYQSKYDVTLNNAKIDSRIFSGEQSVDSFSFAISCDILNQTDGDCYLCFGCNNGNSVVDVTSSLGGAIFEYTTPDGWRKSEVLNKEQLLKDVRENVGNNFTLPDAFSKFGGAIKIETPVSPYIPAVHGGDFDATDPLIRISCERLWADNKTAKDIAGYAVLLVVGSSNVILENPEGEMKNTSGSFPFGTMARSGSEFSVIFPFRPITKPQLQFSLKAKEDDVTSKFADNKFVYTLNTEKYDQRVQANKYAQGVLASQEDDSNYKDLLEQYRKDNESYRASLDDFKNQCSSIYDKLGKITYENATETLNNAADLLTSSCNNAILSLQKYMSTSDAVSDFYDAKKTASDSNKTFKKVASDILASYFDSLKSCLTSVSSLRTLLYYKISPLETINAKVQQCCNDIDAKIDNLEKIKKAIAGEIDGSVIIPLVPELAAPVSAISVLYQCNNLKYYSQNPFRSFSLSESEKPYGAFAQSLYNRKNFIYFEVSGMNDGDHLNLYFKMNHKKPIPKDLRLNWAYLGNNDTWVDIDDKNILHDSTNGLTNSGVISLRFDKIPGGFKSMPSGKLWLRLDIGDLDYSSIAEVKTQAFELEVSADSPGKPSVGIPVPAGSVKKPIKAIEGLKKVTQEYDGTAGRFDESDKAFYTRVSEYLRHKDRAWTGWDYERIILEHFPEIATVKTVPLHNIEREFQPGSVCLMVLPVSSSLQDDDLCPIASEELKNKVYKYMEQRVSSQVSYSIVDPEYVRVSVSCSLALRSGYDDKPYYRNVIEDALKKYLSPWSDKETSITPVFGLNESDILVFLEDLPCVDYITDLTVTVGSKTIKAGEEIVLDNQFQILASAAGHTINIQ